MNIDKELLKVEEIIYYLGIENVKLNDQFYSFSTEVSALQKKIEALDKNRELKNENDSWQNYSSDFMNKSSYKTKDETVYEKFKKEIQTLELKAISKDGRIAMLDLQIHSRMLFHRKIKELQDRLTMIYKRKVTSLIF